MPPEENLKRIRILACAGKTDIAIAEQLEREGFTPCKGGRFTAEIVSKHRSEHQIRSGLGRLRRGDRPLGYTIIEMAQQLDIDPQWIYYPGKQDPHKYSSQFGVATADHGSQGQEINHGRHGNSRKREFGSTFLLPCLSVFSVVKPL
jgi:hypothetical protein